ncbi:MAG: transcriptional regulator [Vibrio sp.]
MTNLGTKYILAQKFIFDPYSYTLCDLQDNNNTVRLGSNESRILLILLENQPQIVSRDQLHEYVWREPGFQVDDSSLTQAISMLRKMLQDSTKSPQFVKTIPKRGYQLICTVESASKPKVKDELTNHTAAPVQTNSVTTENTISAPQDASEIAVSPVPAPPISPSPISLKQKPAPEPKQKPEIRKKPKNIKKLLPLFMLWALIIIIPIVAWFAETPKSANLVQIDTLDNIPVLIPDNQPKFVKWKPVITECTNLYLESDPTPVKQIIITGGEEERVSVNYIYDLTNSAKNKTIVLFFDTKNFESLCR